MNGSVEKILKKDSFLKEDIIALLTLGEKEAGSLILKAQQIKARFVGKKVFLRGLIEYSNICSKNCFYCGIRSGNSHYKRYVLTEGEVMEAARYAYEHRFASIVIQSGEQNNRRFTSTIETLLKKIHLLTGNNLHITLSLGEQTQETYRRWFDAGAHRYLLRIEVSNRKLYQRLHPSGNRNRFERRLEALDIIRKTGFQVGTGVMIGLPFQTSSDLADDLIFFRNLDVDMVGMGPWIEHQETPLYQHRHLAPLPHQRLELTLRMVATLRIMMKDINIAATTAMQAIDPSGRERALIAGANIVMPNLTPARYRDNYLLYENKPNVQDQPDETLQALAKHIAQAGDTIAFGEWGDSKHYCLRHDP
jgi:biotin synthase